MSSITQSITQTNNEFSQALSSQTSGSSLDKDSFMLLLVTQFKYQDPLNPMEDKEFISQMAQFSSLEQLMNLNDSMEGLTTATNNQQMINATSYIGKNVTVSGNAIGKVTDAETKTATITRFRYAPSDAVASGTITVRDSDNKAVYTQTLGTLSSGTTAPDGVYTVSLSLLNSSGEAVLSDQVVDATVTGVVTDNGTVYLGLEGGQLMALSDVRQVMLPSTTSTDTDTSTDSKASSGS